MFCWVYISTDGLLCFFFSWVLFSAISRRGCLLPTSLALALSPCPLHSSRVGASAPPGPRSPAETQPPTPSPAGAPPGLPLSLLPGFPFSQHSFTLPFLYFEWSKTFFLMILSNLWFFFCGLFIHISCPFSKNQPIHFQKMHHLRENFMTAKQREYRLEIWMLKITLVMYLNTSKYFLLFSTLMSSVGKKSNFEQTKP